MSRFRGALLLAIALTACDSQVHMSTTPQLPPVGRDAAVRASATATAGGTQITIDDPARLPEAVRNASSLEAASGGLKVPVVRLPNGSFSFQLPAAGKVSPDLAGNLAVVFVIDQRASQLVLLSTGSPVQFAQPLVQTEPAPATIARGLDVMLTANTQADESKYQFIWFASTSASGPWQTIPGDGKRVKWTPSSSGNYYIKVDAVERASQQAYSAVTPAAVVFVLDPKDVITTQPASGTIARGEPVTLKFNRPGGLVGSNLSYSWSAATSANGPWSVITGAGDSVSWLPTGVGSYFVKVEVSNKDSGSVNTFTSPNAVVFVNESRPIVTADRPIIERGEKINLTLNVANPGSGPFAWFYQRTAAPSTTGGSSALNPSSGSWVPLQGKGKTIGTVSTDAGVYNFRVDLPQADGSVKSFTTADPVLNVQETTPLIHTDPPFNVVETGGSSTLVLEARGIEEDQYRFLWYLSLNPAQGWTSQPINQVDDLHRKRFNLNSRATIRLAAGSYFARCDATSLDGSVTYSFNSTTPVLTITNTTSR
jgi:hypothetical protein